MSQISPPYVYPRPGILQHQDPVPSWLSERLYNIEQLDKLHYEASLNSPHNMLLNCYFPGTSTFMIKPTPRLRKRVPLGTPRAGRLSIDSYNQVVDTSQKDDVPDLVVCRSGASLHGDVPLLIWELKRDDADVQRSASQMERYRVWAEAYGEHSAALGTPHVVLLAIIEKSLVTLIMRDVDRELVVMEFYNVLDSELHSILVDLRDAFVQ